MVSFGVTLVYFGSIDCVAGKYATGSGNSAETDCIACGAGKYSTTVASIDANDWCELRPIFLT